MTFSTSKPGVKVAPGAGDEGVGTLVLQASSWVQEKNLLQPGERMDAGDGLVEHPSSQPGCQIWAWPRDQGLRREGGFTLGRGRLAIQAFLFCVSAHLKL